MPYITQKRRDELEACMIDSEMKVAGELNYKITLLLIEYVQEHGLSYQIINDIVGALECSKQEFYRRVAVPYEDTKQHSNGDVY
jgi:hypothetical protein